MAEKMEKIKGEGFIIQNSDKNFTIDFTKKSDEKMDRERLMELAYPRAEEFLSKFRIKEESFKKKENGEGNYDASMVNEDLKGVKKTEDFLNNQDTKSIERNKLSEIFNAIVFEQFELGEWMGQSNFTIITSKYDKYKTGIGGIIKFDNDDGSCLGLNLTSNSDFFKLRDKLDAIKMRIIGGELSKIKYFNSDSRIKGEFKEIPKVVVGCDRSMVLDIIELWLSKNTKELSEHPLQFIIFNQIKKQIELFKKEASANNNQKVVDTYDAILSKLNNIIESKEDLRKKLESPKEGDSLKALIKNDNVTSALMQGLESVFASVA